MPAATPMLVTTRRAPSSVSASVLRPRCPRAKLPPRPASAGFQTVSRMQRRSSQPRTGMAYKRNNFVILTMNARLTASGSRRGSCRARRCRQRRARWPDDTPSGTARSCQGPAAGSCTGPARWLNIRGLNGIRGSRRHQRSRKLAQRKVDPVQRHARLKRQVRGDLGRDRRQTPASARSAVERPSRTSRPRQRCCDPKSTTSADSDTCRPPTGTLTPLEMSNSAGMCSKSRV